MAPRRAARLCPNCLRNPKRYEAAYPDGSGVASTSCLTCIKKATREVEKMRQVAPA